MNGGHTFNRYCLNHGHDWQPTGWRTYEGVQMYECSICKARQLIMK